MGNHEAVDQLKTLARSFGPEAARAKAQLLDDLLNLSRLSVRKWGHSSFRVRASDHERT